MRYQTGECDLVSSREATALGDRLKVIPNKE